MAQSSANSGGSRIGGVAGVLNGQVGVFLSCSERFKERVAIPIRAALAEHGIHGFIVSDEPLLRGTSGDPESKVDTYLEASDAFVAFCTPDNELDDGTVQTRPNIIDEHARARSRPKLRERIQVFKEPSVNLPSNINPTHENLDPDDVAAIPALILRQLRAWGVLEPEPRRAPAPSATPSATVAELIDGLELGDHEEATRRVYALLLTERRAAQETTVEQLRQFLHDAGSQGTDRVHRASSILEAINRLDSSLVPIEAIEELAAADDVAKRMSSAMLLWDRAEVAPEEVPLGLLGRLALPSAEDWYVHAPAMAATKQLLLRRRAARTIFDRLAGSEDPEDRFAVAEALLDVAGVDITAVPRDLADRLAGDEDELVATKARDVLAAIGEQAEHERDPRSPFGL